MDNTTENTSAEPVVLEPTKLLRFPQVKVFATNGKYEEERCLLLDVINNSGILDKYYPVNNNATNPIVLIYNNLYNPDYGIFRHYDPPTSSRKYIDLKKKLFKDILPSINDKYNEYVKNGLEPPTSYVVGADSHKSYTKMMNEYEEEMKKTKEKNFF